MLKVDTFGCDMQKGSRVFGKENPVFAWTLSSDGSGVEQKSYRIRLYTGGKLFSDSGVVKSDNSTAVGYTGRELIPNTEYKLRLDVCDNKGEIAVFEDRFLSGKLSEKWVGKWISDGFDMHSESYPPPDIFRKFVKIGGKVKRAALYSTALGVYRAYVNGNLVSEDLNAPGFTSYKNRVQYQVYDVTPFIKEGENEVRALVGDGWFRGRIVNNIDNYGSRIAFCAELHIFYEDGSEEVIPTDKSWKWTGDGPIRFSQYYDGESYDATREDESLWKWHEVVYMDSYELPKKIVYQDCPLIRRHERFDAVREITGKNGELLWDLGQNMGGCVRLEINAPRGTHIVVTHGEELEVGNTLYTMNLTNCRQQLDYICKGGGKEVYEPHFTSMGFRYIQIKGIESHSQVKVSAYARYSDLERIGEFKCSYEKINKFNSCIKWTQNSNFQEVPSDCPQRYERMGWTGDFATFIATAVMNLDTQPFARKWLEDLRIDQKPDGSVPWVIPNTTFYGQARHPACCGWADACTIVPWNIYLAYGDRLLLERQYESMKKWVEKERRLAAWDSKGHKRYLWNSGYHFGDWLMPFTWMKEWYESAVWLATIYFANSARILSRVAKILGKTEDAEKYGKLFDNIKKAFVKEYVKADGTIDSPYQGVYVCALAFDLLDGKVKEAVTKQLVDDIASRDGCLASGLLSVAYILDSLSENGRMQEALDLLFNEKMPSWLYMSEHGATTVWESWNGKSTYDEPERPDTIGSIPSHNHYAMGSCGKWIYRNIAGLKLDENEPGYKHFTVEPVMCERVDSAYQKLTSPYGDIVVDWKRADGVFKLKLTVPVNTSADVVLPDGRVCRVGSGKHSFSAKVGKMYR